MLTFPWWNIRPKILFVGFEYSWSLAWLFRKWLKAGIWSISHMNSPQDFASFYRCVTENLGKMIGCSYRKKQQYKTALNVGLKKLTRQRKNSLHGNHPRNLNLNLFYLYFYIFLGISLLRRGGLKVDTVYAFYSADINLSNINAGSEDTPSRIQRLMPESLEQNISVLAKCTDSKISLLTINFFLLGINF